MSFLDIPQKEFVDGIRLLSRTVRLGPGEQALLSFDGDLFYIDVTGGSVAVPAKGEWPDQVRVSAKLLFNLAKVPPRGDPVRILRERNHLKIEPMTLYCDVQEAWKSKIQLPLDPKPADILDLERQYTFEDIMAAGLTTVLKAAQEDRKKLLKKALTALAPLGVTMEDLDLALGHALQRRLGEKKPE
jgi:hypothetical protein